MKFNQSDLNRLESKFLHAFKAMNSIEAGSYANTDEKRQVGHYWLRNSKLAPTSDISNGIDDQITKIEKFGKSYNKLSLDTVKTFLDDSRKSNFKF